MRHLMFLCCVLCLSSCSSLTPYKIDIQQGNIVAQENVSKLKTGMNRSDVKNLLGTPLLTDVYHADRWDYIYSLRKGWSVEDQRKLSLYFEKDVLKRIEGEGLPHTELPPKTPAPPVEPAK